MRYGVPLLGERVAPRCTYADSVILLVLRRDKVCTEEKVSFSGHNLFDLRELLSEYRVDTLICGGISRDNKEFLQARRVEIIDNVACTIDEIVEAITDGSIESGFGLSEQINQELEKSETRCSSHKAERDKFDILDDSDNADSGAKADCLSCTDRLCLRGEECPLISRLALKPFLYKDDILRIIEATLDIACEKERTLCRLSELIYFCLEMRYKRIGIAYCIDLQEPADILARVLKRFFEVYPVCCKIGGNDINDPFNSLVADTGNDIYKKQIACNPLGQAEALNDLKTDLNVIVGICIGADCIFAKASEAPITTLFVKDRSLANNPIGALYSDYYLDEAKKAFAANV